VRKKVVGKTREAGFSDFMKTKRSLWSIWRPHVSLRIYAEYIAKTTDDYLRVVQPEVEDRQSMADYYRMQDMYRNLPTDRF
jgi:hypothetical protein